MKKVLGLLAVLSVLGSPLMAKDLIQDARKEVKKAADNTLAQIKDKTVLDEATQMISNAVNQAVREQKKAAKIEQNLALDSVITAAEGNNGELSTEAKTKKDKSAALKHIQTNLMRAITKEKRDTGLFIVLETNIETTLNQAVAEANASKATKEEAVDSVIKRMTSICKLAQGPDTPSDVSTDLDLLVEAMEKAIDAQPKKQTYTANEVEAASKAIVKVINDYNNTKEDIKRTFKRAGTRIQEHIKSNPKAYGAGAAVAGAAVIAGLAYKYSAWDRFKYKYLGRGISDELAQAKAFELLKHTDRGVANDEALSRMMDDYTAIFGDANFKKIEHFLTNPTAEMNAKLAEWHKMVKARESQSKKTK